MYCNNNLLISLRNGGAEAFLNQEKCRQRIVEESLGEIVLPTGKIVANDPLCLFEQKPFTRSAAPGTYPVKLYVLQLDNDMRVAFAEIQFSEKLPVSFELAVTEGANVDDLEEDEFYGYGVDSGTGGFMDAETCAQLNALLKDSEDYALPALDDALDKSYVYTYSKANVCLPQSANNVVAFSSGYGDGSYPSYWGLDQDNGICCLITDFCIIDEKTE